MPSLRALSVTRLPSFHFLLSYSITKEVGFGGWGLGMSDNWGRFEERGAESPGKIGQGLNNGSDVERGLEFAGGWAFRRDQCPNHLCLPLRWEPHQC
jgi:hypothetical protein